MNVFDFKKMKEAGSKISMITCYDYSFAKIVADSDVNCILVGDTLSMVMHGHPTTVAATVDMMVPHVEAVARGAGSKFIIGDMPFLSYRKGLGSAMDGVQKIMQAGAHAVKMEGVVGNEDLIRHIVDSGVPVMGHLGLTPQFYHALGGFKVQGKGEEAADVFMQQAEALEAAGAFTIVLECIPEGLAQRITDSVSIPTIGIGAGAHVDGQVLVLQDLLGMNPNFKAKLVKKYLDGYALIKGALNQFNCEVKRQEFPQKVHSY